MDEAVHAVDLSAAIPSNEGTLFVVVPGSNKRTGWQIRFAGPGHPKTVAQNESFSRISLDKAERIEMAQVNGRKWKSDGKQPADMRRENVEWVVGRILSWTPVSINQFSADPVEFPENPTAAQLDRARDLLAQPYMVPYFVQMTDYLGDQASFIEASAKS